MDREQDQLATEPQIMHMENRWVSVLMLYNLLQDKYLLPKINQVISVEGNNA